MILCVGGKPAMRRTFLFDRLDIGEVNRAREVRVTASGKVTNAARAVTVLGGDAGRFVARELEAAGLPHEPVWADAPMRVCATVVEESGCATELVEEGGAVPKEKADDLERLALEKLRETGALCLVGSLPPGVPEDLHAVLAKAARDAGVPALVDAQKGLLRAALEAHPFPVKPNSRRPRTPSTCRSRTAARRTPERPRPRSGRRGRSGRSSPRAGPGRCSPGRKGSGASSRRGWRWSTP